MADIRIDTSNLTFTHFFIPEHSSRYIDGADAPTIALEPGSYGFQQLLNQLASFHFEVTQDGHIDYDLPNDRFLDGRGTRTLGVRGFSVTFDATALSHGLFPLVAGSRELKRKRQVLVLSPAAGYGFQSATNTTADFRFGIDVDGQITVDPRYAGFARATRRTPTTDPTLTIDGYKFTVDAHSLSHGLYPLELMDTSGILARGRPHELTYIPAPGYGFQSATNTTADFRFGIDVDGQITVDPRYAGFARATRRTPTTDPTLTIDGYKFTVDAHSLSHGLYPLELMDTSGILARGRPHELTYIPAPGYGFQSATNTTADFRFGIDVDGQITVDPRYAGFARATRRTPTTDPTLTIDGYKFTVDAHSLSHGLYPLELMDTSGILARGRPHELTYIPAPGYGFQSATNTTADFRFGIDVDGQITVDPRYAGFARATDPTLTIDGYNITIDARTLSHDLVPASMFDSGIVLSRDHINELTLMPATRYQFRELTEPVTELIFGLGTDGAIDVVEAPPGATIKSSAVPGTQGSPVGSDGKATRLILVRSADLVLLGVGWTGCARAGDRLAVTHPEATLTVLLPSQSLAEACMDSGGGTDVRTALRAGTSQLEVKLGLPEGAEVPLTTEGILTALAGGTVIDGGVEAPFGLVLDLKGAGGAPRLGHQPAVLTEGGVTSLWQLPVGGPDGGLTVSRANRGSGDDAVEQVAQFAPLKVADRGQIIVSGPVALEYLRLTALGASFTAHQAIENFRWDHRAALGRDAQVVVERTGILWPFNHRAILTETAERVMENGVAGLHLNTELRVTEPVRFFPDDRSAAARAFPFTEVEVLTRSVSGLKDTWQSYPRPQEVPQTLLDDREQLKEQVTEEWARVVALHYPRSQEELAHSDFAGADKARRLGDIQPEISELKGILDAHDEAKAQQPTVPQHHLPGTENPDHPDDPGPDPGQIPEPNPHLLSSKQWQFFHSKWKALEDEETQLLTVVNQKLAELAPFAAQEGNPEGLADLGQADAVNLRELKTRVAAVQGRIERFGIPLPRVFVPCTDDGTPNGAPVPFQIRCAGTLGDVSVAMPLVFVNDLVVPGDDVVEEFRTLDDQQLYDWVRKALDQHQTGGAVPVAGARIDLVRDPEPRATDIQEVHALRLDGVYENRGFRPVLNGFDIELPELRALLPELPTRVPAKFTDAFAAGSGADTAIALTNPVLANFAPRAERGGGLIVPTFTADVVSRTFGPVDHRALPGAADALAAFQDMRLLGIPLSSLLPDHTPPPTIVQVLADGKPHGVLMSWDLRLKSNGILVAHAAPKDPPRPDTTTVKLTAELTPDSVSTRCTMSAFMLAVPASDPLLELSFPSLVFKPAAGGAPNLDLGVGFNVTFAGELDLLKKLESAIDLGDTAPTVDVTPACLTVSYGMSVPSVPPCGVFELRNIAVRAAVEIPFRGGSPTVKLSFATRDDPFQLKVLMFGGGGYLQLAVDGTGLKALEGFLDFGASVAVNFGFAQAEVHALGGIRYVMNGGLTGFIRLGGSIEILGLVSVSIDLLVELTYDDQHNRLSGHATLVIDIDLTLYSDTVQLDSGVWVLAGDGGDTAPALDGGDAGRADWTRYQEAYAR